MKIRRRKFIRALGASVASISIEGLRCAARAETGYETIIKGGWRLQVTRSGEMVSFTDGKLELLNRRLGDNRPKVSVGGMRQYSCDHPSISRRDGSKAMFRYDFSGPDNFSVNYELELEDLPRGITVLKQKIGIKAAKSIDNNVKLTLPQNLMLPHVNRNVFLPMKDGLGRRKPILGSEDENEYVYLMAGECEKLSNPQLLAIPMVDEFAGQTDLRLAHCADPYMSSCFSLAHGEKAGNFNCVYLAQVGVQEEERLVYTGLHRGHEKAAMEVFCATSLRGMKPGPEWLHDVAMVDYDYLSKNGEGWFTDIDTLGKLIAPKDRSKVFLALHGWYDCVGHYSFDWRKPAFEKEWIAFPSALDPHTQSLSSGSDNGIGYRWRKSSVEALRPVPMSLAGMHRRIHYAKDMGFRVGIYYADGTNAGDGVKDVFDPGKVLHWGGWEGPDTVGKTYVQNPLHPEVREFYLRYIQALLDEYGKEVDGFIWDETFSVGPKELGTSTAPGYAGRRMMTLLKEVTAEVINYSPDLAFFASDDIGTEMSAAPYCLFAHGTYQDSGCKPETWPYGLFPNWRNVLWFCNWAPITEFDYSRYGVEIFHGPVPISNGAFGDDIGIGDMTAEQQRKVIELFNQRKQMRMDIGWIEEDTRHPEYQGREVEFR